MMTISKHRWGWMGLALLLVFATLSVPPAQAETPWCNLWDCDAFCAELGCEGPVTCQWDEFGGFCRGICYGC